ncbi:MAG: hypothetical protein GVY19_11805, partial [Bacteroidetes bacterium]|nr:hypothetical protein [Bacteroidota bacterium]
KYSKTIRLNQEKAVDENAALPYLWAREKIRTMADFNAVDNNESYQKKIIDLGLNYNLLTDYTSFVAVDSEIRNTGDTLVSIKQPLPLPEGVPNTAIGQNQQYRHALTGAVSLKTRAMGSHTRVDEELTDDMVFEMAQTEQPESDPVPPGGIEKFKKYILDELQETLKNYPEYHHKTMRVYIKVDAKGNLSLIRTSMFVHQKLHTKLAEVIKNADPWTPAKQNGKPIESVYQMSLTM